MRSRPVTILTVASKKTILVLDDDPSIRHMLRVLLEQEGFAVVAAGDARSALAQCAVQLPDLMIVDLMLPIEDGEMFLREFRRRWRHVEVPVIVLSASTARNDIARRLGAQATLAKPFFAEDLRELVALHARSGQKVAAS
jgi:DNA-binding response OmpR family regulator